MSRCLNAQGRRAQGLSKAQGARVSYVQVVVLHPCRTMKEIKQHCLIGSELPQSLLELDRIHYNRSIPPRHYMCKESSATAMAALSSIVEANHPSDETRIMVFEQAHQHSPRGL